MTRVLVVAATAGEVAPLVGGLTSRGVDGARLSLYTLGPIEVDVLVTGVGMVATAAWCTRTLATARYDLALNLGLCGTFDPAIPLDAVVHVTSECLPELGAEDDEAFLPLESLGLLDPDERPFVGGRLLSPPITPNAALDALPQVSGITVNTVHGRDASIAAVVARLHPDVETMEGAAFMYACHLAGVPFAQVRAVSNRVERRNRAAWSIPGAVRALNSTARQILELV